MDKSVEYKAIERKAEILVEEINALQSEIANNYYPRRPGEPKAPTKPYLSNPEKPKFDILAFFLWTVVLSFPIYYVVILWVDDNFLINALSVAGLVSFTFQVFQYRSDYKDFKNKKKRDEQRKTEFKQAEKDYRRKIDDYHEKQIKYEEELIKFKQLEEANSGKRKDLFALKRGLTELLTMDNHKDPLSGLKLRLNLIYMDYLVDRTSVSKSNNSSPHKHHTYEFDEKNITKGVNYFSSLTKGKRDRILDALYEVQRIHKLNISSSEKARRIKKVLWADQKPGVKLVIGGLLGTVLGLAIFGTGGVGIAGLGGAVGVWGFLAGTTGGVLVSSLIQNFEKKKGLD